MNRCRYRIRKRKKKHVILAVFLLLCVGIFAFYGAFVRPVIRTVSQEEVRSMTVEAVNKAVAQALSSNPSVVELTEVIKDANGDIALIRTDSVAGNRFGRDVTDFAQVTLSSVGEDGIQIPIGSLSGIAFLAGVGPDIKIKAVPVGYIDTVFSSQFVSAGINQTLHKFFIDVTATVHIVIPGAENKVTTTTQVMVGESLIIGKVPDVYLNSQTPDIAFDLVP